MIVSRASPAFSARDKNDICRDPYFLADKVHARESFTAEMLKFYPNALTELDATAVWFILEDIVADAKRLMETVDQKGTPCGEVCS